ncbi:MAG: hypothetical protein IKD54_03620, partial [Clostridia bacterium]|nr:hypothetical protein [Clostridia bacterium]
PGGASEPNRDRARRREAPPKQKHPKVGAFVLEMVLPQSKQRVSAGSMRADSGVNEAPVGLQSRIVTEPAGEKRLQTKQRVKIIEI